MQHSCAAALLQNHHHRGLGQNLRPVVTTPLLFQNVTISKNIMKKSRKPSLVSCFICTSASLFQRGISHFLMEHLLLLKMIFSSNLGQLKFVCSDLSCFAYFEESIFLYSILRILGITEIRIQLFCDHLVRYSKFDESGTLEALGTIGTFFGRDKPKCEVWNKFRNCKWTLEDGCDVMIPGMFI